MCYCCCLEIFVGQGVGGSLLRSVLTAAAQRWWCVRAVTSAGNLRNRRGSPTQSSPSPGALARCARRKVLLFLWLLLCRSGLAGGASAPLARALLVLDFDSAPGLAGAFRATDAAEGFQSFFCAVLFYSCRRWKRSWCLVFSLKKRQRRTFCTRGFAFFLGLGGLTDYLSQEGQQVSATVVLSFPQYGHSAPFRRYFRYFGR